MSEKKEEVKRPALGAWQQVLMSKINSAPAVVKDKKITPPTTGANKEKVKKEADINEDELDDSGLSEEEEDTDLDEIDEDYLLKSTTSTQDALDVPQFVCALCPKTFSVNSLLNLDVHVAHVHKNDLYCKSCKKSFQSENLMMKHEAACTSVQPFCRTMEFVECQFCKHLYRSDKLNDHIVTQHPDLLRQVVEEAKNKKKNRAVIQIDDDEIVEVPIVDQQAKSEPKAPALKLNLPSLKRQLQLSLNKEEDTKSTKVPKSKGKSTKAKK